MNDDSLSGELLHLLGPVDFLKLVERFGGRRLFVPRAAISTERVRGVPVWLSNSKPAGRPIKLHRVISRASAEALASRCAGSFIRVPLAREFRVRVYRGELGLSNAEIAGRLGMTETGVDKIIRRMETAPPKRNQLDLFEEPRKKAV